MIGTYCSVCHQAIACQDSRIVEHFIGGIDPWLECSGSQQPPMTDAQILSLVQVKTQDYFDLQDCPFTGVFNLNNSTIVWDALNNLPNFLNEFVRRHTGDSLMDLGLVLLTGPLFYNAPCQLSNDSIIDPGVNIDGAALIGRNVRIRTGALIRGIVLIGHECVIGHCTEVKDSIMLPGAKAPHRNFVGDSIVGAHANLGNGVCLANWKLNTGNRGIIVRQDPFKFSTGREKFGAIVGDHTEIGCNTVTMPGTLIGPRTNIHPLMNVRGVIPADSIVKSQVAQPAISSRNK